jgi:methionyl-tRNA synthetase
MAKICLECWKVFADDEVAHWEEQVGEYWGVPAYETVYGCPHCGGDFEEATKCTKCGEFCAPWELDDGLCEKCQDILREESEKSE